MKLRFLNLITVVLAALALSSCGEEGVDGPVAMVMTDIVTFEGNIGERSSFRYQVADDSPEIVLTGDTPVTQEEIKRTDRVLLSYIPASGVPRESGTVRVLGVARINQSTVLTKWKSDFEPWDRDSVYIYSVWRTGRTLNFHLRLPYSAEPRIYALAVAPSGGTREWPEVRLVHQLAKPTVSFEREYYASFSIAPVWDSEEVKGVTLRVANSNLDKQIFTFAKGK